MSSAAEDRDRIVRWLTGRGWTSIEELSVYLMNTLHLTIGQGQADLRTLVLAGRIERRASKHGGFVRHYQYRVAP